MMGEESLERESVEGEQEEWKILGQRGRKAFDQGEPARHGL